MSELHLRHIRTLLEERLYAAVDLSDSPNAKGQQAHRMRMSRSMTAFALACMADCDDRVALAAIVDGFQDNGIDAIHYDPIAARLYLLQGKWSGKGGSVSSGDIEKFLTGVNDLLTSNMDMFNDRIRAKNRAIEESSE